MNTRDYLDLLSTYKQTKLFRTFAIRVALLGAGGNPRQNTRIA